MSGPLSFIRTIPSALEFHQTYLIGRFVGFTTGGDLHPALKRFKILYYYNRLNRKGKRAKERQGKPSSHDTAHV